MSVVGMLSYGVIQGLLEANQEMLRSKRPCALDRDSVLVPGIWGLVELCDHEPSASSNLLEGAGDIQ